MRRFAPALTLLAFALACGDSTQPTLHLIQNGSFETGTFAGWTVYDAPGGDTTGFVVTSDTVLDLTPDTLPAPPDSAYVAVTLQRAEGTHVLYQDVTLPADRSATLRATIYVLNQADDYYIAPTAGLAYGVGEANQQFRVDVMDPGADVTDVGDGVLLNVYRTEPGDPLQSGYIHLTADLTPFAGQTVRIRFVEVDNQLWLNAGVDAVDVEVN